MFLINVRVDGPASRDLHYYLSFVFMLCYREFIFCILVESFTLGKMPFREFTATGNVSNLHEIFI